MPCQLRRDEEDRVDAVTSAGTTATIFVKSDAGGHVRIRNARLGITELPVDNTGETSRVSLTFARADLYDLLLTVEGPALKVGDDIQLMEVCDGGASLKKTFMGPRPDGTVDPVVRFEIHAR